MINRIEEVRKQIEQDLSRDSARSDDTSILLSPCGYYQLEIAEYIITANIDASVAVITRTSINKVIATISRNDSRFPHAWISHQERDYLLCSEDFEGQSIVDLNSGKTAGFSSPDDRFIWLDFHPSPDFTKLAVGGCYWACPHMVVVYDFRRPMCLPLPRLGEFFEPGKEFKACSFGKWISESSFTVRTTQGETRFELKD
jgi:hypothetical protein